MFFLKSKLKCRIKLKENKRVEIMQCIHINIILVISNRQLFTTFKTPKREGSVLNIQRFKEIQFYFFLFGFFILIKVGY